MASDEDHSYDSPVVAEHRLFQTVVESSASAVFIFQGETMHYVNASALSITGYSKQELLGMPFWAIIHVDFKALVRQRAYERQSGDNVPASYDVKIVCKNGDERWVNLHASMIELDGKPAVLGMANDITERIQNDERLKRNELALSTERQQSEEAFQVFIKNVVKNTGQDFFDGVTSSLCEWLNADCAIISEIVENESGVEALGMQVDGDKVAEFGYKLAGSPCKVAIDQGYAAFPEHTRDIFPDDKELIDIQAEGYVGVSLRDKCGKAIGVLCVLSRQKFDLPPKTKEILEIVATKAAAQIEHKRERQELDQRLQRLTSQRSAIVQLSTARHQTLEAMLQEMCAVSATTLAVERVSIWLLSEDRSELRCLNLFCRKQVVHSSGTVLQSEDYPCYFTALIADQMIEAHDAQSDPRTCEFTDDYLLPLGITSMLDVPIRQNGALVGVICHEHTGPGRTWMVDELGFACGVADQVAQVLINEKRKLAEMRIKQTGEILEMVASGQPAADIFDAIARMYEARHPGMRCSMLVLKGDKLMHGGAPSLPEAYCSAVNGLERGPNVGSCGTSTYTGKRVLVEDIASDPKWLELKSLALSFGLRSCWSEPIKSSTGQVLGAFGMYYNHPALPNEQELSDLESAARIAGIVMEREQRDAAVRKLSSAIEQAGESIMITDREGIIEYVNPAFTQLTGYNAGEAIGQTPRLLNSGNQDGTFYKDMWATISSGSVWHGKVIDKKKDGSFFPASLTISPIYAEARNGSDYSHFVGIQSDLTEIENLEQQFQQAQKMEAIGTLVGGIAHDFNNMLAGMTGNLYLAKKRVCEMPEVVKKLDDIESIAFRAADMIQQLLTFARKDRVSIKPIPFMPFIKETLKFLCPSVPENITIHQDICSDSLQLNGDNIQIHQVLMNLLNNARDAVEGVDDPCITINLAPFHADDVWLEQHRYFKAGSYAHLSIGDNGCGIPEYQIEHLFEPFFTTKDVGKGTGLGLAMVYGAIKTHQGFVEVDSVEGKGSTFHIYIPLLNQEKKVITSPRREEVASGHGETILLADDEPHIIKTSKEVLESLGYRVLLACNGSEAVAVFKAHADAIDLCIFDVVMPVMGGDMAAKQVRQIKPDVKIIFATGYDKNIQYSLKNETVLSKPFSIVYMSQLIRQQLA